MLSDIIKFVQSRTGMTSREDILREINFAWQEIWNSDDLPNSLFEMSVKPYDQTARITLPHFVGQLRGVKAYMGRIRVDLNTPRPYYHDETYLQSPFTWRILGTSPLLNSIVNATRLKVTLSEAETERFAVTFIGPTDTAAESREQLIFSPGRLEVESKLNYTDLNSAVKDKVTKANAQILGMNGENFGYIPNLGYEARNTVVQISDKCTQCCSNCRCFDILFKKPAPVLYYDEQFVPFPEVLMTKTLEWITLPKEGQEQKAMLYGEKGKALLAGFNINENSGVEHRLDLGRNQFCSYTGSGATKL